MPGCPVETDRSRGRREGQWMSQCPLQDSGDALGRWYSSWSLPAPPGLTARSILSPTTTPSPSQVSQLTCAEGHTWGPQQEGAGGQACEGCGSHDFIQSGFSWGASGGDGGRGRVGPKKYSRPAPWPNTRAGLGTCVHPAPSLQEPAGQDAQPHPQLELPSPKSPGTTRNRLGLGSSSQSLTSLQPGLCSTMPSSDPGAGQGSEATDQCRQAWPGPALPPITH